MCNTDILVKPATVDDDPMFGVRIRPWDKQNNGKMIIAGGETLEEAIRAGYDKCRAGRWEGLDFAKRPWSVSRPSGAPDWGLDNP